MAFIMPEASCDNCLAAIKIFGAKSAFSGWFERQERRQAAA
jgi:hypothetical protein